jgi:hypothetical protein
VVMSRVTWRRAVIVLAVLAIVTAVGVVAVRVLVTPPAGPAPNRGPVSTSEPLPSASAPGAVQSGVPAALPSNFPNLDGFTDVSADHAIDNHGIYPLATFTSPTGLQCAMWSSRGDTAALCFGAIPGIEHPANQVYAGDYKAYFDQNVPPSTDKLNGKPLASGEKVTLGAGGNLMGGDQITCGVQDAMVACVLIRAFRQNHGNDTAQRHGFVLDPDKSWTF